jgi:hypothetical protein
VTAVVFWLSLVLGAYGQTKTPITGAKPSPVQSVKSPQKTPAPQLGPVPNIIGKSKAEADLILKMSGFLTGKVQTTPMGKGLPGTVVKQHPAANTPVAKGSAVDIWIITKGGTTLQIPASSAATTPQPTFHARGKQLFMEFPQNVHKVIVFDAQGNVLQEFKNGRRFDITKSLIKTNAGSIYLGIAPSPGSPVPLRWDPRDRNRIPYAL